MESYETTPATHNIPPDRRDFGIGIVCALPLEATAVIALFDERWDASKLEKEPYDRNTYSIGLIGSHNVVLVHMPRMGKVPSASVAAHLNRSFPNLTLVLMVGICGGVPLNSGDQRLLGDVVISEGIVQYDMGKQLVDRYVKILPVQQPSFDISSVLKKLQTRQEKTLLQDNTFKNLQDLQRKPELQGSAEYPGREWDKVFRADYLHRHRGDSGCGECSEDTVCDGSVRLACDELGCLEEGLEMTPKPRKSHQPLVHFGLIASGDTVVRSGKFRDQIAEGTDVIAFEMEGAGMCMEFLSSLVIKSICDYADSHKNKKFQAYAATTAAAATKAFLQHWTPYKPFRPTATLESRKTMSPTLSAEDYKLLSLLETTPYRDRKDRNPDRIHGTCEWFLNHPIFCDWRNGGSRALWVSADPGCGKSVLAKFLIDDVFPTTPARTTCYFFFKDDFEDQRSAVGALSCILHQLFKQKPILFSADVRAQLQTDPEKLTGSFRNLWYALIEAVDRDPDGEILCIFDALDECEDNSRSLFTHELQSLHRSGKHPNLRFLFTSRPFGRIHRGFQLPDSPGLSVVHLGGENDKEAAQIAEEIDVYIKARVPSICARLRLVQHEQDLMLEELLRVEHRTYLWVYLVLQHIENNINIDKDGIMKALSELPKSVDEAYERILSLSINFQEARRILQIIVAAQRPLTIQEMNFAMSIQAHHKSCAELELDNEDRFQERLRDTCGLFILVVDKKIYLLHQTAREFLVRIDTQGLPETRRQRRKSLLLLTGETQKRPLRSPGKSWNWKHAIDLGESNHLLANICLWHLHFNEVNTDTSLGHTAEGAKPQADEHLFLNYSAIHFANHVRNSMKQANKDKQLSKLLVSICRSMEYYCPVWYRVHSPAVEPQRNALIFASKLGLTPAVKVLLRNDNHDIHAHDATGWSALSWAVAKGFSDVSRILIRGRGLDRLLFAFEKRQVDIDQTVLVNACKNAWSFEMVDLLLKHGADIDARDHDGHTSLTAAVDCGQMETVKLLHDRHPDIFIRPTTYQPLVMAIRDRNQPMVQLLLKRGASVYETNIDGHTPLSAAVASGQIDTVKLLYNRHPDIFTRPTTYQPLVMAIRDRNQPMVQLLLEGGASVYETNEDGHTPLSAAVASGQIDTVKLLHDRHPDIFIRSTKYQPLVMAIRDRNQAMVELLLERGFSVDKIDEDGHTPLTLAVELGQIDTVKLLHDRYPDIFIRPTKYQPLFMATRNGNLAMVQLLLEGGLSINEIDKNSHTPLIAAMDFAHIETVKLLHNRHPDIFTRPTKYQPLFIATRNGNPARVQLLLEGGLSVDKIDEDGHTPLTAAVKFNRREIVKLLCERHPGLLSKATRYPDLLIVWDYQDQCMMELLLDVGADPDIKDTNGTPLLSIPVLRRDYNLVKTLLNLKADANYRDSRGSTQLAFCVKGIPGVSRAEYLRIMQLLLKRGADVNARDRSGMSVLSLYCASFTYYDRESGFVEQLVNDGAVLESRCPEQRTPLSYAMRSFSSLAVIEELLKKGADPNSVDKNGRSVLTWAALLASLHIIELLIENGALVESRDQGGRSVLSWACASTQLHVSRVKLLLKHGADVNTKDDDGRSLLFWSADSGNFWVAGHLIEDWDADVNSKDNHGQSVLSRACENGHVHFVKLLLKHGAEVEGKDKGGRSALWWARKREATEIVQLLVDRGAT